ncbi:hypothetical protein [Sphingomicrobium arenosum]|uniref:hypothetical protein n=1 Tax=Sphingomicrobium arenosum TaxID=2233861 RepID=UPI002241057C|nr:hypothetical protein [Sphingomicrobium arenosum]
MAGAGGDRQAVPGGWWEQRWLLWLLLLLSLVPFAPQALPPLADLPGHYARFAIAADDAANPHYSFRWLIAGNLGVDALVALLGPLLGVKLATKAVVMAIPPLFIAGLWRLSRAATGGVSPLFGLAAGLSFSHPYLFGFVNFALGLALWPWVLAAWIEWRRARWTAPRLAAMVLLSSLVYLSHVTAWGILGLTAFAAEWAARREGGAGRIEAAWRGALAMWPLCLPLLHLAGWSLSRGPGSESVTAFFFIWREKASYLLGVMRDRFMPADLLPVLAIVGVLVVAALGRKDFHWRSKGLLVGAGLLVVAYVLMPRTLLGSAYADMRMAPALFVLPLLVLVPRSAKGASVLALVALAVFGARVATVSVSAAAFDAEMQERLEVLAAAPTSARVFNIQPQFDCRSSWILNRLPQIGAYHIAEKQGFSNNMWRLGNASPLTRHYLADDEFGSDPSQYVRIGDCGRAVTISYEEALARFPREAFDYLFIANLPRPKDEGLELVAGNEGAALYRITTP